MGEKEKAALVFVDVETSGLLVESDVLFEVGVIITTKDLEELARVNIVLGPRGDASTYIRDPKVLKMHQASGLLLEVALSNTTCATADTQLTSFLQEYHAENLPMAGSTVQFDRKFVNKNLWYFESLFHYRNVDVSTVSTLVSMWGLGELPPKREIHRAIPDLEDSIARLKAFRDLIGAEAVAKWFDRLSKTQDEAAEKYESDSFMHSGGHGPDPWRNHTSKAKEYRDLAQNIRSGKYRG